MMRAAIVLLAAATALAVCDRAEATAAAQQQAAPVSAGGHRFCGWLYGSRNPELMNQAYGTFAAHAEDFDAVHPTWFHVASLTTIEARSVGFEDARVIANTTRGGKRTKLIPTIQAEDRPDRDYAHTIINDPELRRRHVAAIVDLVTSHGYDGIDLDYEHLNQTLGRGQSAATERQAFNAFVAEAAAALHAAGKTLSLAVPVVASRHEIYDYEALSASADHVHVMGYDYHYEQGPHGGPVAPLGWIREVVSYIGSIDGGRRRDRFILGLPNYGLVGTTLCNPSLRCLELAGEGYRTTTDHMDRCDLGEAAAGRAPNRTLADGEVMFFDDIASLEEKVEAAAEGGLGGVAYWSIGGEPDRPGPRTFFEMVRSHFPRCP